MLDCCGRYGYPIFKPADALGKLAPALLSLADELSGVVNETPLPQPPGAPRNPARNTGLSFRGGGEEEHGGGVAITSLLVSERDICQLR